MCYRCGICQGVVPPRLTQRRHIISRVVAKTRGGIGERTEIELEIPVCASCDHLLREGMPLTKMREMYRPKPPAVSVVDEIDPDYQKRHVMAIEDDDYTPSALTPAVSEPPALKFADSGKIAQMLKAKKRRSK